MNYVYISGKITDNENYAAQFEKREKELKTLGYLPVNPVRIRERLKFKLGREPDYQEIINENISELKKCDYINFLNNWRDSDSAREAYKIAAENNIPILKISILSHKW